MPRAKQVTLRHIAEALGLTVHTVSKALRGLPGMSEATRREVVEQARKLGYLTKAQEAGLSAERIPWVGGKPRRFVLLLSGELAFHRQQLEGVQNRLNELGHTVHPLLVPRNLSGTGNLSDWLERCGALYADGLFLTAALPKRIESELLALPLPKVLINYPPDAAEVDSVIWDVEHAIHRSMDALAHCGHRRVLYVGDIEPFRGFRLRWTAFQSAVRRLGLGECPTADEHVTGTAADRSHWMDALREKLSEGKYTAVLSAIPNAAEWVFAAAGSLRLNIPGDVSLVGMEHEEHPYFPGLSRPVLLVREAGERAAELMLRRIANPVLPYEHVRLLGSFEEGRTLRPVQRATGSAAPLRG